VDDDPEHFEAMIKMPLNGAPIIMGIPLQVTITTKGEAFGPIDTVFHSWLPPQQVPSVRRRGGKYVVEPEDDDGLDDRRWRIDLTGEGFNLIDELQRQEELDADLDLDEDDDYY
jgi:hypothetical protein